MQVAMFVILLISAIHGHAQERYEFYKGIRQMGMGGSSVAVANDETGLLSNPASLGRLRDFFITVIDPELEVGTQTQQIANADLIKMRDPQQALDKCKLNPDKHLHERAQLFPSIVVPNFGLGVFGKYQIDAQLNSLTNKFQYDYVKDYAIVTGLNYSFFGGIFKIGTNARIIDRVEVRDSTIDPMSTSLNINTMASSGVGFGTDTGIILTAPVAYLPTLAAVWRDVGRTSFNWQKDPFLKTSDRPLSTDSTVDVGLSIQPILGRNFRSTWTIEYRDVKTAGSETDQMRRVHGGLELNVADAFFIRGGLNQRYWTAGLELAMMNYQLQLATYGEDIGATGSPREDRRYELKLAIRF